MDSRVADSEAKTEEKQGVPAIIISKASPDTATTAEQDHAPATSESEVRGQIELQGQAGEVTSQYVHDTKTEEPSDDRGSVSSSADRSADEGLVAMETDSDDAVGTADDVGIVHRSSEKDIEANGSETRDTLEYGKSEDSQSDGEKVGEDEGGRDGEGMEVGSTEGEMEERRASEIERQDETGEEGEEAEMMDVDDGGKDQGKLQGRMEEPQMDTDDKIVEELSLSSIHGETSGLGEGASSEGVIETSEQEKVETPKGVESQKEGEEGCESKIDEHQIVVGSDDGAIEAESSVTEDKKEKEIIPDQDTVQSSSNNRDDAKEVGREDDVCKDDDGKSRKDDLGEENGEKDQGGMERVKEDSEMEEGEISPDSNVDLESHKKTEVEKSSNSIDEGKGEVQDATISAEMAQQRSQDVDSQEGTSAVQERRDDQEICDREKDIIDGDDKIEEAEKDVKEKRSEEGNTLGATASEPAQPITHGSVHDDDKKVDNASPVESGTDVGKGEQNDGQKVEKEEDGMEENTNEGIEDDKNAETKREDAMTEVEEEKKKEDEKGDDGEKNGEGSQGGKSKEGVDGETERGKEEVDEETKKRHIQLIDSCLGAMKLCLQRFPQHYKSAYRMAFLYAYTPTHKVNICIYALVLLGMC